MVKLLSLATCTKYFKTLISMPYVPAAARPPEAGACLFAFPHKNQDAFSRETPLPSGGLYHRNWKISTPLPVHRRPAPAVRAGARAARPPGAGEKLATSPKTFGYAGIIIVYFTIMLKHSKIFTVSRACVSAPAVQSRQGPALRPGGRTGGSPRPGGSGAEAQDPERGVSPGNRAVRPKRTMRRVNLL